MRVVWEILIPAVLLLGLVLPLHWGKVDPGESHRRNAERPTIRGMLRAWQNWLDLVRAPLGFVLLQNAFVVEPNASDEILRNLAWIKMGILGAGLIAQLIHFDEGIGIYAPTFYMTGLTPVLSGELPGGFAILFGWLFVAGAKDPRWLLPVMAIILGVSAYFLDQVNVWVLLNSVMFLIPFVVAFVARRFPLHVCRGLRPVVPALTSIVEMPQFRRSKEDLARESSLKHE